MSSKDTVAFTTSLSVLVSVLSTYSSNNSCNSVPIASCKASLDVDNIWIFNLSSNTSCNEPDIKLIESIVTVPEEVDVVSNLSDK